MSKRDNGGDFDDELINAEFESMVEGLSLDQSSPTTYLDELDAIDKENRFTPPTPPKRKVREQYRKAKSSFIRWKNNRLNENPGNGAEI